MKIAALLIDSKPHSSEIVRMDMEDFLPRKRDDAASALGKQDLDPLSVDELDARIALLQAEISRCEAKKQTAIRHRSVADSLFKR